MHGAPARPRLRASGDSLLLVELEPRLDLAAEHLVLMAIERDQAEDVLVERAPRVEVVHEDRAEAVREPLSVQ